MPMHNKYATDKINDHNVVNDKTLPITVRKDAFEWCKSMQLLAVVSKDGTLWIYRADGKRIWSFPLRAFGSAAKIKWSEDGKLVGVVSKTSGFRIYDVLIGKMVGGGNGDFFPKESQVKFFNWKRVDYNDQECVNGFSSFNTDLLKMMPKLSPLSSLTTVDSVISSRLANDGSTRYSMSLDFAIVGFENKSLTLALNKTFLITFDGSAMHENEDIDFEFEFENVEFVDFDNIDDDLGVESKNNSIGKLVMIIRTCKGGLVKYKYSRINTTFLEEEYNREVISLATSVSYLLEYLKETSKSLNTDYASFLEFQAKLISVLNDDSKENNHDFEYDHFVEKENKYYYATSELNELLLTGMMSESLKSWLENSLGEKNLKKWSKLGNNSIEQVKNKLFGHFIPATQRLLLFLNSLKSQIILREGQVNSSGKSKNLLGLNSEILVEFIDEIVKMIVKVYNYVSETNDEQKVFNCFINWLSGMLEVLKDEDKNANQDDLLFSVTNISCYITGRLDTSQTFDFISDGLIKDLNGIIESFNMKILDVLNDELSKSTYIVSSNKMNVGGKLLINENEKDNILIKNSKMLIFNQKNEIEFCDMIRGHSAKFEICEFSSQNLYVEQIEFTSDDKIIVLGKKLNEKDSDFYLAVMNLPNSRDETSQQIIEIHYNIFSEKNNDHFFEPERFKFISTNIKEISNKIVEYYTVSLLSKDLHRYNLIEFPCDSIIHEQVITSFRDTWT